MNKIKDIAAEMRNLATIRDWHNHSNQSNRERILDFADRIEKTVTNCNQFKMREALICIDNIAKYLEGRTIRDVQHAYKNIQDRVKIALSTPPRNCDLFEKEDDAFRAHRYALEDNPEETSIYYEDWIFAKAKGKEK